MLLSVILVSYNSGEVLKDCFKFLRQRLAENFAPTEAEIIVVDNASTDKSRLWLSKQKDLKQCFLKENLGFSRGNNIGLQIAKGKFVLFLNTDVYLKEKINFKELLLFLDKKEKAAGLTIRLNLANNQIDPASHRGFPTPFNAFAYYSGLEKLTTNIPVFSKFFGGYHLTSKNLNTIHEIDSPTAAFFLVKKKILDDVSGFDPDYFFYGEDLDLSYRIKSWGYSIWYYPKYQAWHIKYQSGQKNQNEQIRRQAKRQFYETMLIFYEKHYADKYPQWLGALVRLAIKIKSSFGIR
jgi:GT2 family glycosyltransferase